MLERQELLTCRTMNPEPPNVPITTLAGLGSLTDALLQLPLPSSIPGADPSLLFHPRVCEEAGRLIDNPDETALTMIPHVKACVSDISVDQIHVNDPYVAEFPHYAAPPPLLVQALSDMNHLPPRLQQQRMTNLPPSPPCPSPPCPSPPPNSHVSPAAPPQYDFAETPGRSHSDSGSQPLSLQSVASSSSAATAINDLGNLSPSLPLRQPPQSQLPSDSSSSSSVQLPSSYPLPSSSSLVFDPSGHPSTSAESTATLANLPSRLPEINTDLSAVLSGDAAPFPSTASFSSAEPPPSFQCEPPAQSISDAFSTPVLPPQEVQPPESTASEQTVVLPKPETVTSSSSSTTAALRGARKRRREEPPPEVKAPEVNAVTEVNVVTEVNAVTEAGAVPKVNAVAEVNVVVEASAVTQESASSEGNAAKNEVAEVKPEEAKPVPEEVIEKVEATAVTDPTEASETTLAAEPPPKKVRKLEAKAQTHDERSTTEIWLSQDVPVESPEPVVNKKPVVRRVTTELIPVISITSSQADIISYKKLVDLIDQVFETTEEYESSAAVECGEEAEIPSELLIPTYQLEEIREESYRSKMRNSMELIGKDRLIRFMKILEVNMRDSVSLSPYGEDDDEDYDRAYREVIMDRIGRSADAALIVLYILTSKNMSKRLYIEDVIDRLATLTMFQLTHSIFPAYDPVYKPVDKRNDASLGSSMKKKRSHAREVREESVKKLYRKLNEVVSLMSELVEVQALTDTTVLKLSTLAVAPFFVENVSELQLSALKLITVIFSKYTGHRKMVLEDVISSIARLPSSKRGLRAFHIRNSDDKIQMLTALVLQMIHSVVIIPTPSHRRDKEKEKEEEVDVDQLIVKKYEEARAIGAFFIQTFFQKCCSKSEEVDYRPVFENFIADLLTTVNRPEWPAAEMLLQLLGLLLTKTFGDKGKESAVRIAAIEYLGIVTSRLRKDAIMSRKQIQKDVIDDFLKQVREEESFEDYESSSLKASKKEAKKSGATIIADPDEQRNEDLMRLLLDYLAVNGRGEPSLFHARHFHLSQWYKESQKDITHSVMDGDAWFKRKKEARKKKKKSRKKKRKNDSSDDESDVSEPETMEDMVPESVKSEINELVQLRKKFLLENVNPFRASKLHHRERNFQTELDSDSAILISKYLNSKRELTKSFDTFLTSILRGMLENVIGIRTRAMKCLALVVEADPNVLTFKDVESGCRHSFLDTSTAVREAALDLVGKYILHRRQLVEQYYPIVSSRILDKGVSVRKRVIRILRDICVEFPDFPRIPELCIKIIGRVNDEEGIRKLVMEVFQSMWFTPTEAKRDMNEKDILLKKVNNITDVVGASTEVVWFEQLLQSLFMPREDKDEIVTKQLKDPPPQLIEATRQIVDCLVDSILKTEGDRDTDETEQETSKRKHRLASCAQTLKLIARVRPQLLVPHASILQPYLAIRKECASDNEIVVACSDILEIIVPLMSHPSPSFLTQLEEDTTKNILTGQRSVVHRSIACLASVVNRVTKNYNLIEGCYMKYFGFIERIRKVLQHNNVSSQVSMKALRDLDRSMMIVGYLHRFFDFRNPTVRANLPADIVDKTIQELLFFVNSGPLYQLFALRCLGQVLVRHFGIMLRSNVKALYRGLLQDSSVALEIKSEVLGNLELYLREEDVRMNERDKAWAEKSQTEDLKEMADVTSGMASTIVQVYLSDVMNCFMHSHSLLRRKALQVTRTILEQGLVQPVTIIPYLICMCTDLYKETYMLASSQLQELEKKHPGFTQTKAMTGIRLSYKLQEIVQDKKPVRGYRPSDTCSLATNPNSQSALNGFLYSILRTSKVQRRGIVLNVLKRFDDLGNTSLPELLFLADNLAYFPYQVTDEPLFIMHHIDLMVSLNGSWVLDSFRRELIPKEGVTGADDDDEENPEEIVSRLPPDTSQCKELMTTSQSVLLLLMLKQHLKDTYALSDNKVNSYSPSESSKIFEKSINVRKNIKPFNPTVVIEHLKKQKTDREQTDNESDETSWKEKLALIHEYLDFKHLMSKIDPDEGDEQDVDFQSTFANYASGGATNDVTTRSQTLQTPQPEIQEIPPNFVHSQASAPPPPQAAPSYGNDLDDLEAEIMANPVVSRPQGSLKVRIRTSGGVDGESASLVREGESEPVPLTTLKVPKIVIKPPVPPPSSAPSSSSKGKKPHRHRKKKKKKKDRYNSEEDSLDESNHSDSDPDFIC
ncbi:unnamed protein product [Cyprideis torosa]|uniref:Nipped-B protein n=1 Tax=Cyprideis torosa TaxID=163714 RepID=A0A7R8W3N9_9CRUS|nr:unnamed protein product [Cyprideis torosa]CAG0882319.1 unnamed protein product [Cyprideis torosa]